MRKQAFLFFAVFFACFVPFSSAQTQVAPFTNSNVQFFDNNGKPVSGGKLCTFIAGTSTPQTTYSESTGTTPNANPVVLDSAGRATIYLTNQAYKFILGASTANSVCSPSIWTQDNVTWNNMAISMSSLSVTGNVLVNTSTAATGGANQSGPTDCDAGNYWTGSVSAVDKWCWQDVLGTGSNPTSTYTLTHSGSSGTTAVSFPSLTVSGAVTAGSTLTANPGGLNRLVVDNSNYVNVFSRIRPIQPDPLGLFPLGNDLSLEVAGTADLHIKNNPLHVTATTSLGIGANPSVAVSSTASFTHATGTALVIEPGTANEETVVNANWSIVNGTTLSITAAKTHTQPYTISQQGSQFWAENSNTVLIVGDPLYNFTTFTDNHGDTLFKIPQNGGAAWPNGGSIQFSSYMQGGFGANSDLVFRNNTAASSWKFSNAANSANLITLNDSGTFALAVAGSQMAIGKTTPTQALDIQGTAIGATFAGQNITDGAANRVNLGYINASIAGTKLVPVQIVFGNEGTAGDLAIGSRGNVASSINFLTSPDAGTTGLVKNLVIKSTGNLALTKLVDSYNGTATAGIGTVPVYGATSQKAESAADTNVLTFTPPATAGTYRLHFVLSVSAAASAVLGWTATWTDSNGAAQAPANLALFQSGAAAPALTFTTSAAGNYYGEAIIDINNAATAIVVKFTLASGTITAKASATIERLQ